MIEIIFKQPVFTPTYEESADQYTSSFIRYVIYDSEAERYYIVQQLRGTMHDGFSRIYVVGKGMFNTKTNDVAHGTPRLEMFDNNLFPILETTPERYTKQWNEMFIKNLRQDIIKYERIKEYLLKEFEDLNYLNPEGALSDLFDEVKKQCKWLTLQENIQDSQNKTRMVKR